MRKTILLLLATAMAAPVLAKPAPAPTRPVMVAGNDDLDACLSTSFVRDMAPGPNSFLAVRAAPALTAREIDRIRPGHVVWNCDGSRDGQWVGIVYHPTKRGQDDIDCDLGRSDTPRRPYRGNCRSGWVSARYLLNLAG